MMFLIFGLKLGIDFTGGSLLELSFTKDRPTVENLKKEIENAGASVSLVQTAAEKDVIVRMKDLDEAKHQEILKKINEKLGEVEEKRFESIGPTIGKELQRKSFVAIGVVLLGIVLYLAYAFRKVSAEISSWKFGVCAIVALFHDLIFIVGIFALLGKFKGVEIDTLFVTALLTVLGFSVHDTIVVFDRIRYNLIKSQGTEVFMELVNRSVNQTIARSLNTTITTLLVLFTLYLFGGSTIKWFNLALILGMVVGTYSSIFVASPFLVAWQKFSKKI